MRPDPESTQYLGIDVRRVPGNAVRSAARVQDGIEIQGIGSPTGLRNLVLQVIEQVAVVGASGAAEDHVTLVGVQVIGKAEAGSPVVVV